jgi:hypothetical protein
MQHLMERLTEQLWEYMNHYIDEIVIVYIDLACVANAHPRADSDFN